MALIPPHFLDCVVSIGIETGETTKWIGTGFIVALPRPELGEPPQHSTFLVTNKHVLENTKKIKLRFNSLAGNITKDYTLDTVTNDEKMWSGHPSAEIDIAAITINSSYLLSDSVKFTPLILGRESLDNEQMKSSGLSEGDQVYVLGYPLGIVSENNNYVIARAGVIARIRDMLAGHSSNFLIDSNIFPGNSGGPVIVRPEAMSINGTQAITKSSLIGIVKSYVPFNDVAISQQTGRPRVIFEENSGLALVESVTNIIQTVQLELQRAQAIKNEQTQSE